jgi:hypothetical protein
MTKIKLTILITLLTLKLIAQDFPNNFKIGDYLEIYSDDSIKLNYNCVGFIIDNKCADYVRIGKLDTAFCNLSGNFKDYFHNGKVAFECFMKNNKLNGKGIYYYENGQIKETGNYLNDDRNGIWQYFYDNGKIEKVLNFQNGIPLVACYNTKRGKPKVINGSTLQNEYTNNQKIFIQGYIANENVDIYENLFGCPSNSGVFLIEYKNSNINNKFYPEFIEELKTFDNVKILNQWILVGLTINENNNISKLNIYSSKNDRNIKNKIKEILYKNANNWITGRINKIKVCTDVIFTIVIYNNEIIIPAKILHDKQIKWLKGEK